MSYCAGTRAHGEDAVSEAGRTAPRGGGVGWWRGAVETWWCGRGRGECTGVEEDAERQCVVLLTCEDTGCGIAEEEQRDVFQAFMQVSPAPHAGQPINRPFVLTTLNPPVPPCAGQVVVGSAICAPLFSPLCTPLYPRTPLITQVVVDDNMINRRVAAITLARYGAEVALAESGEAALRLLQACHSFRLVVMDLLMPGLDGFHTTARLRAFEAAAQAAQDVHRIPVWRPWRGAGSSGNEFMWWPCQQM
ncbi:unnamed protein product [Closterium sp. Naga37s-1]|nr:unnamed protein product [Closterium sp. Naga37s-1]CAI5509155.1 unnamed protein product [Closterium sp. Naga37s-1]CAI5509158.1 unnamed protein product [Closterium sp. Naga37s-1]CAI5509164.1 unnamed protein product [Closterium sp. Naga37s-1]